VTPAISGWSASVRVVPSGLARVNRPFTVWLELKKNWEVSPIW
jgi:hypothetical protein